MNWGADGFGQATGFTVDGQSFDTGTTVYWGQNGAFLGTAADIGEGAKFYSPIPEGAAAKLVVFEDGSYVFTLLDNMLLGQGVQGEQVNFLDRVTITGEDGDGDPIGVVVDLKVQDDIPSCFAMPDLVIVEDEKMPGGNDEGGWFANYPKEVTATIINNVSWGADQFGGTVGFVIDGQTFEPGTTVYWDQSGHFLGTMADDADQVSMLSRGGDHHGGDHGPHMAASLIVNADGTYTFTLLDNMLMGQGVQGEQYDLLDTVKIIGQDGDGDRADVSVILKVQDDVPGCMEAERVAIVEDEQKSGGIDEPDAHPDYTDVVTGDVSNNGNWGADGFDKITTIQVGNNQVVNVGHDVTVYWSQTGAYLGTNSHGAAASLRVEADGDYTYRLLDNMLISGNGEQTDVLANVVFTGQDKDGDKATINLTLDVKDDVPGCMEAERVAIVEDEQKSGGIDEPDAYPDYSDVVYGDVSNNGNWGADGFDKITTIKVGDNPAVNVGHDVTVYWSQTGVYLGTNSHGAAASLNVEADGDYTYRLLDNMLLSGNGEQTDVLANVVFTGQDKDGDKATINLTLDVKDDVPGCMEAERVAIVEDEQKSGGIDEPDAYPDYTDVVYGDVSNNGNWGADGFDKITTIKVGGNPAVDVGNGVTVYWSANGTYLGTSSNNAAASLKVEADGDYTYRLLDNMLLSGNGEQTNVLANVVFTGQDKDGDKATINLTLDVMDDVPVARDDSVTQTVENQSITFNVFGNDLFGADGVDTDNSPAAAVTFTQPTQGTVTYNAVTGLFTYTPVPGAGSTSTKDSFTYTIKDGDGDTSTATVSVTLKPDSTPTVRVTDGVVDEQGLPTGTGELADGIGANNSDASETTTGSFTTTTGGDTLSKLEVQAANGTWVDVTSGGTVSGANGTLTVNVSGGNYTWSYTLTKNLTTHNDTTTGDGDGNSGTADQKPGEAFAVRVTDSDNDVSPTTTLDITVNDDAPVVDVSSAVTYTLHVTNYGETEAGFHNSFGYYIKAANGTPTTGMVVWDDVKDFENGSVDITGYTPDQVGFFIIPDGDNFNSGLAAGTAVTFALVDGKWQAFAGSTPLVGDGANVLFDVQALNADGFNHLQDNSKPGNLNWEDIAGGGDKDWDDVNIGVTWTSNLPVLTTQDAQTIGAASDTAFASFASMFSVNALVGADGLGSAATSYKLSVTNADAGLTSDGKAITLAMVGNDVVGSTTDGEIFRISVDSAGKVTLTQAREVDHLPEDIDANNDNAMLRLADGKVALTATATVTDADGDVASDSQKLDISSAFRFEDDLPSASNITKSLDEDSSIDINLVTQGSVSYGADGAGSITLASNPLHGTVTLTNGVATYKPNAEYSGSDSFTYTVIDGDGDTVTKTVNLTVNSVNDPPVAKADTNWGLEDAASAVTGNVLQTLVHDGAPDAVARGDVADTDIDSTLTVTGFTGGNAYGTLTLNPNGSYSYALNSGLASVQALDVGEKLTETYTYTVTDGTTPKTATLTITIFGQNDAPVANADTNWVVEDAASAITGNVLESHAHNGAPDAVARGDVADTDVDVETLTVTGFTGGNAYGTLTLNANGSYSYALNNSSAAVQALNDGDKLTETYTYTVSDGTATKTATLTITIFGANDPVLVVGENVNDNSNQTVDHRVDTSPSAPDGSIDGSSSHDVLVGDVGGNNQLAGQKANIAFVLDISGSMIENKISFTDSKGVEQSITRLAALKQAVIDALNDLYASGGNDVRVHIDAFATKAGASGTFNLTTGGLDSPTQLQAAIDFVNALQVPSKDSDQYTNYEAGLVAANNWIDSSAANAPILNADVNKVIFVSDGAPNRALDPSGNVVEVSADEAIQHVLGTYPGSWWWGTPADTVSEVSLIETNGAGPDQAFTIESVGISVGSGALGNLSQVEGSGGSATNVDSANELSDVIGTLTGGGTTPVAVGNDVINGGGGNDVIFGDSIHADNADGGWAKFVANHAGWTTDQLRAELYANHATYGQEGSVGGTDTIDGGAGNDVIYGQKGNDTITGGAGDDLIVGGSGSDTMSGGTGADTFKFVLGDASVSGAIDHITDFSRTQGDILDLKDLLVGEDGQNPGYNMGSFMSFVQNGANTELTISDTNGTTAGGNSQTIVFDNTNLFTQFSAGNSQDLIQKMVAAGNLKLDNG